MSCTKCNCFFCQFINYSPHIPLLRPDLRILLALGTKVPKRVFHKQRWRQNAINFNVDMEYEEEEENNYSLYPHPLGKEGRWSSPKVLAKHGQWGVELGLPSAHVKSWCSTVCLSYQHCGGRDRLILGACWLPSWPPEQINSRLSERPCFKKQSVEWLRKTVTSLHTQPCWHLHIHIQTHTNALDMWYQHVFFLPYITLQN